MMMTGTTSTLFGILLTLCVLLRVRPSSTTTPAPCEVINFTYNCSHHLLKEVPKGLPPTLKVIILSHNRLHTLTTDSFSALPNLVKIDVSYNDISKISPGAFSHLSKLESLILKKTQLSKPESGLFQGLTNLKLLDISHIHQGLTTIPDNLFKDFDNLQELKMDGNDLSSLHLGDGCALSTLKVLSLANNTFSNISNTDFVCFKNCNLSKLLLSGNVITHVDNLAFSYFNSIKVVDVSGEVLQGGISPGGISELTLALGNVKLESLRLAHLHLISLTKEMFYGLKYLTNLDLSNNWIKTFEEGCFRSLVGLKQLDLYNNNISRINNQTFSALSSLEYLDMARNNVTVIFTEFFISLSNSNLSYLNLKLNGIKKIDVGAFRGLKQVGDLELAENYIHQLLEGDEFDGLDDLQTLNLGANTKIDLKSTSFSRLLSLRVLILNKVQLKSITLKPSPFSILSNLETLDLSNNNMDRMYSDVFYGLKKLQKLYLNHNNLYLLLGTGNPILFLNGLSKLLLLDLSSNGISNIHVDSFADLKSLTNLSMNHNQLMKLPNNLFKSTVGLQHLDLSNNKLNIFNHSMFDDKMPRLKTMAAGGSNPFACTCDLEWFRNWIDTSKVSIVDIDQCICASPPSYRKKPILSFHPKDLNCDHVIPIYVWVVSASTFIVIVVITFALIKKRYYFKYLYYVVRAHTKGYQPIGGDDNGCNLYRYDAFVSHSSEDENWVKFMRGKLEDDNGFKLCFHKRDFDIGKPITTNIIESIEDSYRTICVITGAFLESGWCKYELQFALSRLFKERKEVIILIFLEKIPDNLLTDQLKVHRLIRRFIKDNTYLEWPENAEEEPLFWEKLKDSLRM